MNTANTNQHKNLSFYIRVGITCFQKYAYTAPEDMGLVAYTQPESICLPNAYNARALSFHHD